MDERLAQSLTDWLIAQSLAGRTETDLLTGLCERMVAAGIPLFRVSAATDLLHPAAGGQGLIWRRTDATHRESYPRGATPEGKEVRRLSPFHHMVVNQLSRLRRRFKETYRTGEFPLLDRLKAEGATEYLALIVEVSERASLSAARAVASSWTVDRPGGFGDADLALIERLAPTLTLVVNAVRNVATGRMLLDTYLGTDAAERVLSGNILRGQADTVHGNPPNRSDALLAISIAARGRRY